jgi:hypothetical protein
MKNSTLFKKWFLVMILGIFGFSYSSAAIQADTATILSETFATSLGKFTTQSVTGAQVWAWNSSAYAKITGFVSPVNNKNDDWLISPSINLANASSALLSFTHAHRYGTDLTGLKTLKLYVTDSYISGAIDTTKWTEFTFKHTAGTSWTFINSGDVNLDSYLGKRNVHFAFRYISDSINSSTWEIKNVSIRGLDREVIFAENFNGFTDGTVASPATANLATSVNTKTQSTGWVAENIFSAGGTVKLGGSAALGTLKTPNINLSQDGGKFYVSFYSARWANDTSYINILVNDVQAKTVTGIPNQPTLNWFGPIELTGGTSATTIKFAGAQAAKGRFYLDSLIVTQQVPAVPMATLPSVSFKAKAGTTQTINMALTAKNITGDLTVTLANKAGTDFSTTVTTVTKANAIGGTTIAVDYKPLAAGADTATVTISGGGLVSNVVTQITGIAYTTVVVPNLGALRAEYVSNPDVNVVYELSGTVMPTNVQTSGNSKYVQDATGGILIYDVAGAIKSQVTVGIEFAGLVGTLTEYGKQLEFIPISDINGTTGLPKEILPVKLTIPQAKAMKERYESMYVFFENLTYTNATAVPNWGTAKGNFNFVNGTDTIVCRTNYTGMDYMTATTAIPTVPTNFAGMLLEYNGTLQFYPRSLADIGYSGATVLPSGLSETTVPASVWGSNGTLNVLATQGQSIEVFNLVGQRLIRTTAKDGVNSFTVNKNQLYLVRLDNRTTKIVL